VVKVRDEPVEQRPPRIEINRAKDALGHATEIVVHVEEKVDAGRQQQNPPNDPFGGDQAKDAPAASLIVGFRHPETLVA